MSNQDSDQRQQQGDQSFEVDSNYSDNYLESEYKPHKYRTIQSILERTREAFDEFINEEFIRGKRRITQIHRILQHPRCIGEREQMFEEMLDEQMKEEKTKSEVAKKLRSIDVTKIEEGSEISIVGSKDIIAEVQDISENGEGKLYKLEVKKGGKVEKKYPSYKEYIEEGEIKKEYEPSEEHIEEGQILIKRRKDLKPLDKLINKLKAEEISLLYAWIRGRIKEGVFSEVEYFYVFSEYFRINEKVLYEALPKDLQGILLDRLNSRTNCVNRKLSKGKIDLNW